MFFSPEGRKSRKSTPVYLKVWQRQRIQSRALNLLQPTQGGLLPLGLIPWRGFRVARRWLHRRLGPVPRTNRPEEVSSPVVKVPGVNPEFSGRGSGRFAAILPTFHCRTFEALVVMLPRIWRKFLPCGLGQGERAFAVAIENRQPVLARIGGLSGIMGHGDVRVMIAIEIAD